MNKIFAYNTRLWKLDLTPTSTDYKKIQSGLQTRFQMPETKFPLGAFSLFDHVTVHRRHQVFLDFEIPAFDPSVILPAATFESQTEKGGWVTYHYRGYNHTFALPAAAAERFDSGQLDAIALFVAAQIRFIGLDLRDFDINKWDVGFFRLSSIQRENSAVQKVARLFFSPVPSKSKKKRPFIRPCTAEFVPTRSPGACARCGRGVESQTAPSRRSARSPTQSASRKTGFWRRWAVRRRPPRRQT